MPIEITDKDIFIKNNETHFIYNECEYEMWNFASSRSLCLYKVPNNKIINLISEIKYKNNIFTLSVKDVGSLTIDNHKNIEEFRIDNLKYFSSCYFSTYDGVLLFSLNNYTNFISYYPFGKKDKIINFNNVPLDLNELVSSIGKESINNNPYLEEIIIKNKYITKKNNLWMINNRN